MAELGQRALMGARALEVDAPVIWVNELGRPTVEWTAPARDAWRKAAEAIEEYRDRFRFHEVDKALGATPKDLGQRRAWGRAQHAVKEAGAAISGMFSKAVEQTASDKRLEMYVGLKQDRERGGVERTFGLER